MKVKRIGPTMDDALKDLSAIVRALILKGVQSKNDPKEPS